MPHSIILSIIMRGTMFRQILFFAALPFLIANAQTAAELKQEAEVLKARGDAAGALERMVQAVEADPTSAGLEDETGFLLAVLKRNPEAKPHFERAIQLDPTYAAAHFHLGVLYWLEKDPDHGIPFLQT